MEIAATGTTIWLHESSLISFMGNTRLRYSGLTVSFWVEYVMLCSSMYKPPPMIPLRHKLHTKVFPIILPPPISWWLVKLSISYWFPEEHPYIGDFSRFTAYVRTRDWYARTQRLPPMRTWFRKTKAGYHRHDDTLPLFVLAYRSAYSFRKTSDKQKTYPNPFS